MFHIFFILPKKIFLTPKNAVTANFDVILKNAIFVCFLYFWGLEIICWYNKKIWNIKHIQYFLGYFEV